MAVVVAFFVCWAPFHVQRLLALAYAGETDSAFRTTYAFLHFMSGVLYYVSATINPVLYNLLSAKFRRAFKVSRFFLYILAIKISLTLKTLK